MNVSDAIINIYNKLGKESPICSKVIFLTLNTSTTVARHIASHNKTNPGMTIHILEYFNYQRMYPGQR